jgi:hypothetical protein
MSTLKERFEFASSLMSFPPFGEAQKTFILTFISQEIEKAKKEDLETLIKECGESFTCLKNNLDEWHVWGSINGEPDRLIVRESTPKEAVRKFLDLLNKEK